MPFPLFGAVPVDDGVRFRVWAPAAKELRLVLHGVGEHVLPGGNGAPFELIVRGIGAGQRYSYRIDGSDPRPDPASRSQPEGVHGPSEVIDPRSFVWHDQGWGGLSQRGLVIYELHVGTFTAEGTFASLERRLETLRDLGVTAVELMPVADFAGSRNWGYDGVALYAPSRAYGRPDDLRSVVDAAHRLGLGVILDVVYNHLGPEGAYLPLFNHQYLLGRHNTPWGSAVNLDGPGSSQVRQFIIDNAVHWVREYHIDGLRLDATHALVAADQSDFVQEFGAAVRSARSDVLLHAEDHRNLAAIVSDDTDQSWGFDGVWADDFHHVVRRMVAGDEHGYYSDYAGTTAELARTITQGWLFTGEPSRHMRRPRGTDPSAIPMYRFVVCVQNHDQIGNRACGDRLHHGLDAATWRTVSTLLLTAPMTPLLFMGQEWAAGTPFQFFTDLSDDFGKLVTAGRRQEFREMPGFAGLDVPDPQAMATFEASRLRWEERGEPQHARVIALYQTLLRLRQAHRALGASDRVSGEAFNPDDDSIVMRRRDEADEFYVVARLRGGGRVDVDLVDAADTASSPTPPWTVVFSTEDGRFTDGAQPPRIEIDSTRAVIEFKCPSAVILGRRRRDDAPASA